MIPRNRTPFILLLFFALGACSGDERFSAPDVRKEADGREYYVREIVLDQESARGLRPGRNSPEAAVVHFFASMIRKDNAFREVMPADPQNWECDERTIEKYRQWTFHQIRLKYRKEYSPGRYWISLYMEVEFKGEIDRGEDDVTVRNINGKWYVIDPPT